MSDQSTTIIKAIPGFDGYFASDDGFIWSENQSTRKQLKPWPDHGGYLIVGLMRNGHSFRRPVHKLILETFIGPRQDGMEACHGEGGKQDNSLGNLRWGTRFDNMHDHDNPTKHLRRGGGAACRGEKNGSAKLTPEQVLQIRAMGADCSQRMIGQTFGISQGLVWQILNRRKWRHI